MRIPSGVTDQVIYFVAVDATDLSTRETGLSSFTVYRARNGAAAAAMTTPTVTEVDATNMPGVYSLLLDEDMTIGSGNDSEEMVFHITHAGMAPVTRTIELYRPKITAGETLTVASGVASANATQISGDSTAADNLETMLDGTGGQTLTASITGNITGNLSGSVGSVTGNVGGNVTGTIGGLTAAALADFFDTDSGTDYSSAVAGSVVKEIADNAGGSSLTVGDIADAVWDEALSGHTTAGTAGKALSDAGSAGDPWSTALPGSYTAGQAGYIIGTNLDGTVSSRASQTSVDTVDSNVDAILVDTAEIGAAGAGLTAVPWNAAWDAEVQSECADALAAYDPPTNAEMVARTLASADYATAANQSTIAGYIDTEVASILAAVDTEVAAIKAVTDNLPDSGALTSLATASALATVDSNVDSILADTGTDGVVIADKTGFRLSSTGVDDILDEVVEGTYTMRQLLRGISAALLGEVSGAATTEVTIRNASDSKSVIVATVDSDGNRSAVTLDLT